MKNISFQISLLLLIAIKVTQNEAARIKSAQNSLSLSENVNTNEENPIKSSVPSENSEKDESLTGVVATQQGARDTKYSYFYIGRWTWHIPLWFTLWFSFYVFFNVIRSIYGHAVSERKVLIEKFEGHSAKVNCIRMDTKTI